MPTRGVVLLLAMAAIPAAPAQNLQAIWDGSRISVSAPAVQIVTGPALERLRNGASVAFDFHLTLRGDSISRDAAERFAISYDLWEERFSVTRLPRDGSQQRSATHLTADAAAAWCFDNIVLPAEGVEADLPVRLRLEIRTDDPRQTAPILGESGVSLTVLVDILSRPSRAQQQKWMLERGPVRLAELRAGSPRP